LRYAIAYQAAVDYIFGDGCITLLINNLRATNTNHIAVGGTDMTDSIRPTIPAEGGININALVGFQ
jgi:hypothetical protein